MFTLTQIVHKYLTLMQISNESVGKLGNNFFRNINITSDSFFKHFYSSLNKELDGVLRQCVINI